MYVCIYLYINNKDEITNIYVRIYININISNIHSNIILIE